LVQEHVWGMELHRGGEISLSRQIFVGARDAILAGRLSPGEALPSTRQLAGLLGVSRNTVCDAYDMLLAEGFLVSRQGSPTRVAEGLAAQECLRNRKAEVPDQAAGNPPSYPPVAHDFQTGRPDLREFPWTLWARMVKEAGENLPPSARGYGEVQGYVPLRREIAGWLFRSRGMRVEESDIFITAGATQALHLLADLLPRREGDLFALESPSHPAAHAIAASRGFSPCWIPVDQHGAQMEPLEGQQVAAVYVTPSHQFPLGGVLPAPRRAALIRMAEAQDFYIIEDDYDSEFRYAGAPISPLYTLDQGVGRVIYVGSFSKTMFPALRLGFAIVPPALQEAWRSRRTYLDVQSPVLEQAALALFFQTRSWDRHIRRMKRLYGHKREVLLESIAQAFRGSAVPWGDAAGLHLALQFPGETFSRDFISSSRQAGIRINPLSVYCPGQGDHGDKLLVGYGHLNPREIRDGIEALASFITGY
jgi:GntR family transcriptional regulator/MocR family aminotransferase